MFDILDGVQALPGAQIRTGQDGTNMNSVSLVSFSIATRDLTAWRI